MFFRTYRIEHMDGIDGMDDMDSTETIDDMEENIMGKVISLMNEKGGVGKSALTLSSAWELAKRGKRVLIIDMDGQMANVSYLSGVKTDDSTSTMSDVLLRGVPIRDAILPLPKAGDMKLDIVPATVAMAIIPQTAKIRTMKKVVQEIRDDYDYVFLDVNPSPDWRHALTMSVLDGVVVVMRPDVLSLEANHGIFDSIEEIQESMNPGMKVYGFILNCFDPRTRLGAAVVSKAEEMAEFYGTKLFDTKIRNAVVFSESAISKMGVTDYAPKSSVAEDIRLFVTELEAC